MSNAAKELRRAENTLREPERVHLELEIRLVLRAFPDNQAMARQTVRDPLVYDSCALWLVIIIKLHGCLGVVVRSLVSTSSQHSSTVNALGTSVNTCLPQFIAAS